MIDKINRLLTGGPRPELSFAERALKMAHHHKEFMMHSAIIEKGIADKKQDMADALARISALNQPKV